MNDEQIEQEIQAKGLTAPRVTPQDIEANISAEYYFTAENAIDGQDIADIRAMCPENPTHIVPLTSDALKISDIHPSLALLTFCVLVLKNGFTVTGESVCASPENFDAEVGRKIARKNARQNAVQKIWPLMGYALKEHLHKEARGDSNQYLEEQLRWHAELRNFLLDKLQISDPAQIAACVDALVSNTSEE